MRRRDTVLVVDDSVESLNFLTDALEDAGLTVLVALGGMSAIELVERVVPDIVLLDAVMPGLDGFETCQRLKANSAYVDLPIIFMTGLSETEHIIRGFRAGGADYVTKPIVPDELLARIQRHLSIAHNSRSAKAALDLAGRYLIAVDSKGNIVWTTPQASRLLKEVLGLDDPTCFAVPYEMLDWQTSPSEAGVPAPATIALGGQAVQITYTGRVSDNEIILRLSVGGRQHDKGTLRDAFSLTEREADVLLWLSAGKSNKDIAQILSLSPRTVNKYLDQIYAKMSVENRAAAAAQAVRALSAQ